MEASRVRRRLSALAAVLLIAAATAAGGTPADSGLYRPGDWAGKQVAVTTGTVYVEVVGTHLPDAIPAYFNNKHDAYDALQVGKVAAVLDNEVSAVKHRAKLPNLVILKPRLTNSDCGVLVRRGDRTLLSELNAFIKKIRSDGAYDDMVRRWLYLAEPPPMPDIETPGGKGRLVFGTAGITDGFSYYKDGEITGFDIEFARRFARESGKTLEVVTMNIGALIPAVNSGKLDFAANLFSITPERKKNVDFSDPYYQTGGVLSVINENDAGPRFRPGDFAGKKIGVLTGTVFDRIIEERIPGARPVYFNQKADYLEALRGGKIDAIMDDDAVIRRFIARAPDLALLRPLISDDEYGMIMARENTALKAELDAFIAEIRADGVYDDMIRRWLDTAEPPPMPDVGKGAGPRKLVFGTAGTADGFSYLLNGEPAGFDIEFARRFAKRVDAHLEIVIMDFGGLIPAIGAGKLDFAADLITITEERRKNVGFTRPYYFGGSAVAAPLDASAAGADAGPAPGLWERVKESFEQNLIVEARWKLIARGLGVTLLISFAAFLLGTILAFGVCCLNMSENGLLRLLGRIYVTLLRGTPIVVLLMIIYYVVFASVNIDSVLVAIIAYGLNAAAYIGEILRSAILTVDKGQVEAARSMGFGRAGAFLTVTLPQAVRVALPVYKSEFVSLVKSTAVVGYIAIADLTKAGDVIRSRTYDAFFPLLSIAAIYLATTSVMVWIFDRINLLTDKRAGRTK